MNREERSGVIYLDTGELWEKELCAVALTSAQCEFFKLFGYIYLPNLLTEDIEWLTEEHQAVFEKKGMVHDGGGRSRRHFDLNVASRAKTDAEIAELDSYLQRDGKPRYYPRSQSVHSEVMRQTASPERMYHLEQVIERETYLSKM